MATNTKTTRPIKQSVAVRSNQKYRQTASTKRRCPRCNAALGDNSKFCPECGIKLNTQRKKRSELSVAAFIISFIPLFGFAGMILAAIDLKNSKTDNKDHSLSIPAMMIVSVVSFVFTVLALSSSNMSENANVDTSDNLEQEDVIGVVEETPDETQESPERHRVVDKPLEDEIINVDRKVLHENEYTYEDRWVRIAGKATNINAKDNTLWLNGVSELRGIICYFMEDEDISRFAENDYITVVGLVIVNAKSNFVYK